MSDGAGAVRAAFIAVLLVAPVGLAGCTILKEAEARELSGPTDGYTPTANYLKIHVKKDDGTTVLLDFDRRDWYTAKIADMVDTKQVKFVAATAMPRDILREYVAQTVASPSTLQDLRYDEMDASPEARADMDAQYGALLERYLAAPPLPTAPPAEPTSALPDATLP